jgi:fatty acid desaturase
MRLFKSISDPVYNERPFSKADKFFLRYIKDKRDLPFIYLLLKVTFFLLPLAVLLFLPFINGWLWWVIAVSFQVINAILRAPFGLMMHSISHRQLFKNKYKNAIYYITWFIGPFIGHTPETYFSHHIGMHHPEGNMPDDDSSTMFYQRDSLKDFFKYVAEFIFTGLAGLLSYLKRKNRRKLARKAFTGEMCFYIVCIFLCFVNWQATVAVFIFTFFISRILMMLGNWTQHAFIDPVDPENPYKNCINCLNIRYNHIAWNDGYHSSHHLKPTLHWTDHPASFRNNLEAYAKNRAVIFEQLDYAKIFVYLMRKRYDLLAKNFININNTFESDEEIMQMLRSRTQKFDRLNYNISHIAA